MKISGFFVYGIAVIFIHLIRTYQHENVLVAMFIIFDAFFYQFYINLGF